MKIGNSSDKFVMRQTPYLTPSFKDLSAQTHFRLTLNGYTIILDGLVLVLEK